MVHLHEPGLEANESQSPLVQEIEDALAGEHNPDVLAQLIERVIGGNDTERSVTAEIGELRKAGKLDLLQKLGEALSQTIVDLSRDGKQLDDLDLYESFVNGANETYWNIVQIEERNARIKQDRIRIDASSNPFTEEGRVYRERARRTLGGAA